MTTHDYYVTMKSVRIADFKARLSEHLRYVRRGHGVTILDRDTPVAQVLPLGQGGGLAVRPPLGQHRTLGEVPLPARLPLRGDVVALLLEERQGER